jgi:hypothetical protein
MSKLPGRRFIKPAENPHNLNRSSSYGMAVQTRKIDRSPR